ncbi:MAG: response regulator transcription factor [Acholeplasmataceae bacterium]
MYKLLIVDDEIWSRRLIREVLNWKSLGFDVIHEAENGIDALNQLKTYHHLMIMDMRMPGMDGVELLTHLGAQSKTKIIVMSGYDDFDYIRQALKGQAIDYLLKPIIKTELERAVKQALAVIRQDDIESNLLTLATSIETNHAFIKYLSLKNQLYSAIIDQNESDVISIIDTIDLYLNKENKYPAFRGYVYLDLGYMIDELKDSHLPQSLQHIFHDMPEDNQPMQHVLKKILHLIKHMGQRETKGKLYIEQVIAYVDTHYTKNITLESLSLVFYISKEHLSRAFKKETGKTVSAYVNEKRILLAQQLMVGRHLPIKTAAAMTGFVHLHYFYKVFKQYTEMTPIAYINSKISI